MNMTAAGTTARHADAIVTAGMTDVMTGAATDTMTAGTDMTVMITGLGVNIKKRGCFCGSFFNANEFLAFSHSLCYTRGNTRRKPKWQRHQKTGK